MCSKTNLVQAIPVNAPELARVIQFGLAYTEALLS